jgi:phage terminase large subunit-like protein
VRVVVAVDPALTSGPESDETGIVIAGKGADQHGYVLGDRSCRLPPSQWTKRVVDAYHDHQADYVVCEKTAGDLLKENLEAVDANVPIRYVGAKVGKRLRASPVANLYEKGKVHHVSKLKRDWEALGRLEAQMVEWVPDQTPESHCEEVNDWLREQDEDIAKGRRTRRGSPLLYERPKR